MKLLSDRPLHINSRAETRLKTAPRKFKGSVSTVEVTQRRMGCEDDTEW